jgi:hypothetical protein
MVNSIGKMALAYIGSDGSQYWYLNDKRHREDGPATIGPDGSQAWFLNGKYHREDGPAIIYPDGTQEWWSKWFIS